MACAIIIRFSEIIYYKKVYKIVKLIVKMKIIMLSEKQRNYVKIKKEDSCHF